MAMVRRWEGINSRLDSLELRVDDRQEVLAKRVERHDNSRLLRMLRFVGLLDRAAN